MMFKKNRKRILVLTPISVTVGIISIVSTSCFANAKKELLPFDGTIESIEKIGKNIQNNEFVADKNILLNEVKWTDIKWIYATNYPNIEYDIRNEKKHNEYFEPNSSTTLRNVVTFKIGLFKKGNTTISYISEQIFYIDGFK